MNALKLELGFNDFSAAPFRPFRRADETRRAEITIKTFFMRSN